MSVTDAIFDVEGRVFIVTGASSGLGERFVEVLHAAGAKVVAAARRRPRLDELAERLPGVVPHTCDVSSARDRGSVVEATIERFGRIDGLVNNAGVSGPSTPAEDYPASRWDGTIDVNLTSLFSLTQEAARPMLAAGSGVIVHVGSALGLVAGHPMMEVGYAASKGAVVNLTRELGAEWASRGVRVNAIAPGWFASEMTAAMGDDDRSMRYVSRGCPLGRMGEPSELDGILLFLCSDASRYCVGQTIAIDGGWTIR